MSKYSENAIAIYKRLYFDKLKNETKPIHTHERIAKFVADDNNEISIFLNLLENKVFRPNSPCMINAGSESKNPHDNALSACYVLGLEDSMDSIIDMWGVCAKIYASGAGSGIPITNLREKGAKISTGGQASGPLAYLSVVDLLSNTVRSGGKTRRAANMGVFKYNHPDVIEILDSKLNEGIQTFNLSMSVTDDFMNDIENGQVHLLSPSNGELAITINKKTIWKKAIKNAWTNGDPGLFFYDTVNEFNPFPSLGPIDCTNPCGEVPLPPWSVCNIGSINVAYFVRTTPGMADSNFKPFFDWTGYRNAIKDCFLFLDNVIDKQEYIHEKFMKNAKDFRPVGLGIMGFADALIKLGIAYDSNEAIKFFKDICHELTKHCILKSLEMAKDPDEWTVPVPAEDMEHFRTLLKYYLGKSADIGLKSFDEYGIHNSNWTMIAPTGSTSMSADCSYSWEPLMALVWEKPLVESDKVLTIVHPEFEKDLNNFIVENYKKQGDNFFDIREKIFNDIINNKGSIQSISYLPDWMKDVYKVAHDIDPINKIEMQAAGQENISMAISSTVNLPNSATEEDIENIYLKAWELRLKGITVFRDGCRENQIVHFGKKKDKKRKTDQKIIRPIRRPGFTIETKTPHGKLFTTVNYIDNKPSEIFLHIGKQGGKINIFCDALARLCSKALQAGMNFEWIIDTLEGLKGDQPFWFKISDEEDKSEQAESIIDALAKVLDHHFNKRKWDIVTDINIDNICESKTRFSRCPECGKKALTHSTGCRGGECLSCGFTNCS